jgi:hypothetical protein
MSKRNSSSLRMSQGTNFLGYQFSREMVVYALAEAIEEV